MTSQNVTHFIRAHWRDALEIALLWALIYEIWTRLRETRGIRILTGVVLGALGVLTLSELLHLPVLDWLLRNVAALSLFALVVIFQPELRRAAVVLGNNRIFSIGPQSRENLEILSELTFELANRQLGALIAIERDLPLDAWAESGVELDSTLSVELGVTLFFPKTPLHDGGVILRSDRVLAGACIFPITQRTDLDRNLGLRHRAALGLSEVTDSVILVVSEETGIVSICHNGTIERDFEPNTFKARLSELLAHSPNEEAAK